MEVDFDKQIDTILRDLAKGNSFIETQPKSHLDADELSAFAENVLPAKARLRMTEHLADCSKCRKILTNFISLSVEEESETIHEEAKIIPVVSSIPWYSKLFAFPQLAYTMGAFVLLFSGMVGYLVFQSSSSESNIAQMEKPSEQVKGPGGPSAESEEQLKDVYSSNKANSSANTSAPAPMVAANSSAPANTSVAKDSEDTPLATPAPTLTTSATPASGPPASEEKPIDAKNSEREIVAKKGGEPDTGKVAQKPQSTTVDEQPVNEVADNNISRQQTQDLNIQNNRNQIMTPDGGSQTRRNMPNPPPQTKSAPRREDDRNRAGESAEERYKKEVAKNKVVVTKTIGNKTFESLKGIWTDTAYKGGSTKNIKRGTNDYKKLDSGLQNIGNSFSETVIIVWSGKNYKIQ